MSDDLHDEEELRAFFRNQSLTPTERSLIAGLQSTVSGGRWLLQKRRRHLLPIVAKTSALGAGVLALAAFTAVNLGLFVSRTPHHLQAASSATVATSPAAASPAPIGCPSIPAAVPNGWKAYCDPEIGVQLSYPGDWPADPLPKPPGGAAMYISVEDNADPISGAAPGIAYFCHAAANHVLKPYGSSPTIQSLQVDGQPACLVLPSNDQGASFHHMAALYVRMPKPKKGYINLAVEVDQTYISPIAATVRFV